MKILELLKAETDRILPDIVQIRRAIHQNPEVALQEYETAELVRKALQPCNLELLPPFLETDVVAMLRGSGGGKNVTLRADMDALPIQEETGLPHASRKPGFMHACGHDGHTAMLIGAAMLLCRMREHINGSVRFVFQPGEEIVAAGKELVSKGALLDPKPDAVLALHGLNNQPTGSIASRAGVIMAACGFFKLRIIGKGAHGARPEISVDPILTAARIVEALQSIVSRHTSPFETIVLSVCRISSGANANVIPQEAEIEGTTRYFSKELGERIRQMIERTAKGVCDSMGASYELEYNTPYIPTVNAPGVVRLGQKVAHELRGPDGWLDLEQPSMGAEDFSYYVEKLPGALFRIGLGEDSAPLHNPRFDFNDEALGAGIAFLATSALAALAGPGSELHSLAQ